MSSNKTCLILVNYNTWRDTTECLESLFKLQEPIDIVVVDNASTDDSVMQIKNWAEGKIDVPIVNKTHENLILPKINKPINYWEIEEKEILEEVKDDVSFTLIKAANNGGFSAGNNIGIKHCLRHLQGAYFWLLNNDTVVEKNCLAELIAYYKQKADSKLGILGSKIAYYSHPTTLQCVGGGKYNKWLGKSSLVKEGAHVNSTFKREDIQLDFISGASMFMSKKFIEDVGLMSEEYFLYFEELDWTYRSAKMGYYIDYNPNSIVYHKGGESTRSNTNSNSVLTDFYYSRNKLLFTNKHLGKIYQCSIYLSFVLICLKRLLIGQANRIPMFVGIILNPHKNFSSIKIKN